MTVGRIVLYGDFNCPWSHLASRRAAVLAADGVDVDWRAVEHQPWQPGTDGAARFAGLREELDRVLAALLPGEQLPYSLAGFLPFTRAATSGYAEAYAAGVAVRVRDLLFEAYWMHAVDLGDAEVVHTLLVDAIRSGSSASEVLRDWGYAVEVTGGPVTTVGRRLVGHWAEEWRAVGEKTVPVLLLDGAALRGVAAVEWLGAELSRRGLDPDPGVTSADPPTRPDRDLAPLSRVSRHGNRWLREYQQARRRPIFPSAS